MAEIKFNYRNALPSNPNPKELYFIKNNNKGLLYRGSELIAETSAEEIESLADNVATALQSIQTLYETKADAKDKLDEAKEYTNDQISDLEAGFNEMFLTAGQLNALYGAYLAAYVMQYEDDFGTQNNLPEDFESFIANADEYLAQLASQPKIRLIAREEVDDHAIDSTIHFTAAERTKLSEIEEGAEKNTITGVKGNSETSYRTGRVNITKANIGLGNVDDTSDANKPVSTAQQVAINEAATTAKNYTDEQVALLLNNSSDAIDSIFELAEAMQENDDIVQALSNAVGIKADKAELANYYTKNEVENDAVLITAADIDVICGQTIAMASEVTF